MTLGLLRSTLYFPMINKNALQQELKSIDDAQKLLDAKRVELRRNALKDVVDTILQFGFTMDELGFRPDGAFRRPKSVPSNGPKFQSPYGSETWTGVGRQPAWYQRAKKEGFTNEDLLIAKAEAAM